MPLLPSHTLLQAYVLTLVGSSYLLIYNPLVLLNASPLWLLGESMHIRRGSFVPPTPSLGTESITSAPGATLQRKKSIIESVMGGPALLSNEIRETLALLGLVLFLAAISQSILAAPLRYSKKGLLTLAQKTRVPKRSGFDTDTDTSAISDFAGKVHTIYTVQTLFLIMSAVRVVLEGALVAYIYLLYSDRSHTIGRNMHVDKANDGLLGLLANRITFGIAMSDMLFWGYLWTVIRQEATDVTEVLAMRVQMLNEDRE